MDNLASPLLPGGTTSQSLPSRPTRSPSTNSRSTESLNLYCLVVGVGCVTVVTIDGNETISQLKRAIKECLPATVSTDAAWLSLFAAEADNRGWLRQGSDVSKQLHAGKNPQLAKPFIQKKLADASRVSAAQWPDGEGVVHVLVCLPEYVSIAGMFKSVATIAAVAWLVLSVAVFIAAALIFGFWIVGGFPKTSDAAAYLGTAAVFLGVMQTLYQAASAAAASRARLGYRAIQ